MNFDMRVGVFFLLIFSSNVLSKEVCNAGFCSIIKANVELNWTVVVDSPRINNPHQPHEVETYLRISREIIDNSNLLIKNLKLARGKFLLSEAYCKSFILDIESCNSSDDNYTDFSSIKITQERLLVLQKKLVALSSYLDSQLSLDHTNDLVIKTRKATQRPPLTSTN